MLANCDESDVQKAGEPPLRFLTDLESRTVEAMSARIIPTNATPGAREAGVVRFIDAMLRAHYATWQSAYRDGISRLNHLSADRFGSDFAALEEGEQDKLLELVASGSAPAWKEASGFFEMVRLHTIEGFLSDPKYGGNRDGIAWVGLL